jgi:hypothetical protein
MPEIEESLLSPDIEAPPTSWYSETNKELVTKKGWKTGDDALKSYTELERSLGSRVKMPSPESSAEEIRAFYQKTGCPENPEGYEIKEVAEGAVRDEISENELKKIAYQNGVSKQAFESIVKGYYDNQAAQLQQGRIQGEKQLREELGTKYDAELTIGKRFCAECSDEFKNLLETTGLGNSPIIVKEFIRLGKKTMSDTLIKGDTSGDKEGEYVPKFKDSPSMYASGEDEDSKKARAYFESRGHKY